MALAYAGVSATNTAAGSAFLNHPAQYRGGIVGRAARFWWGSPTPAGEQRAKLHIPIAGDLAALSADLLFSDPPDLRVDDTATQGRIESYVENGLWTGIREAAEIDAALGGTYLRVVWDRAIADRPWLSTVAPESAIPEWSWDRLAAVTFWRVLDSNGRSVLRHLERHEPGAIIHGLYAGTREDLGRRIPLTDHPDTAGIAKAITDGDAIETGTPLLTAEYIPNMRPNRIWRNLPSAANLGRSDFSGLEPQMDALDECWSSWLRDIRLGKARIIVPQSALESLGQGAGAAFDSDREVFTGLDLGPEPDAAITMQQFKIRMEEHRDTATALVEQIVRDAGYSVASLGGTGDVAMTATEVVARERRSMTTRGRKAAYWSAGLRRIIPALLAVDAARFRAPVTPDVPAVAFPEAVSVDPKDVAETVKLLADAGAASTEVLVRMVHPEWDDTRIAAEVAAIEKATAHAATAIAPVVQAPPGQNGTPQ